MHSSFFSVASALTYLSFTSLTVARVAHLAPRDDAPPDDDGSLVCQVDTINEVFMSAGMGDPNSGAQGDIERFCRSWIDIPSLTSYVRTTTPTITVYADTATANITTQKVFSATSTLTETVYETGYALAYADEVDYTEDEDYEEDFESDTVRKRSAAPMVTARAVLPRNMEIEARYAINDSVLSSVCSCMMYSPLTLFDTLTADPATRLISATRYRPVTINSTVPGGETTVTKTVQTTSIIEPTEYYSSNYDEYDNSTATSDAYSSDEYTFNATETATLDAYSSDEYTFNATDTATLNGTAATGTGEVTDTVTDYYTDETTTTTTGTATLNVTATVPPYTYWGTAGTGYPSRPSAPGSNTTYWSSYQTGWPTDYMSATPVTVTEVERVTVSVVTISREIVTVTRAVATTTLSAITVTVTDGEEYVTPSDEATATENYDETEVRTEVSTSTETISHSNDDTYFEDEVGDASEDEVEAEQQDAEENTNNPYDEAEFEEDSGRGDVPAEENSSYPEDDGESESETAPDYEWDEWDESQDPDHYHDHGDGYEKDEDFYWDKDDDSYVVDGGY